MKKINKIIGTFALIICTGITAASVARAATVLTGGLRSPNRIVAGAGNTLLVTEAGTSSPNSGRISIVDRNTGDRSTLIDGLPSAMSFLGGPAGDPDGPSGLRLVGQTLFVTIGVGDAVVPGPGPGLESPNPGVPSSPLFDSILEISMPKAYQSKPNGFTMTVADQAALAAGSTVILTNGSGREMSIRMVANLPDYKADARPGNPNNVKASHLYGVETFQKDLYVVDAGHNLIHRVNVSSGADSIFVTFPSRPNPLFPALGGPFIEAVPDNIHRSGNQLLVPLLTGFPFIPGTAEIRSINLINGSNNGLIPNLTSAIDVLSTGDDSDVDLPNSMLARENSYFTLEFSTNQLAGALGRLRFYSSASAAPVDVDSSLITPTSMVRDADGGRIFVTSIATGTVATVAVP